MRILIAEDDPTSRRILETFLRKLGYEVVIARDGGEALQLLEAEDAPRLVLLDWMMPGVSGIEICQAIRQRATEPYTYVLLVTAKAQKADIVEGLEAGADDYITKPFDLQELRARLRTGCRILELQAQLMASRAAFYHQSTHDSLTGLLNHKEIIAAAERELVRARREGRSVGLILADLDHFKEINDRFGHPAGDVVLSEIAARLATNIRSYDYAGRYGGEEFLLVIPDCDSLEVMGQAERIRACVAAAPLETPWGKIAVTMSLGAVASEGLAEETAQTLIWKADQALYRAKKAGRNRVETAAEPSVLTQGAA